MRHIHLLSTLVLALLLTLGARVSASHLMGGEITAKRIDSTHYEVFVTQYRDTLGIPAYPSILLNVEMYTGATPGGISTFITSYSIPYDTLLSGLLPSYPYGVEAYVYHMVIPVPSSGAFRMWTEDCCRNASILNLLSPASESMFLSTDLTVYPAPDSNSTPVFLVPPVVYLPINAPWQYNPLPFDFDGDSLVWYFDVPYSSNGLPCAGYALPPNAAGAPIIEMDSATGVISWIAGQMGNFNLTVMVDEYRNGVKIGTIRRDMQLIVVPNYSKLPQFTNLNSAFTQGSNGYERSLTAGQPVQIVILGADEDTADLLTMECYGSPMMLEEDAAAFSFAATGNGNEVAGTFAWTPSSKEVGKRHSIVLRLRDGTFSFDETVTLRVEYATANGNDLTSAVGALYPNPASSAAFLPLMLTQRETVAISIVSATGSVVRAHTQTLEAGQQLIALPLRDLAPGVYWVRVAGETLQAVQRLDLR